MTQTTETLQELCKWYGGTILVAYGFGGQALCAYEAKPGDCIVTAPTAIIDERTRIVADKRSDGKLVVHVLKLYNGDWTTVGTIS